MDDVLNIEDASFRFRDRWVLDNLSFGVKRGDIVGIIGPNASGKTTLMRIMYGGLKPQKGKVRLMGEDLRAMSRRRIARRVGVAPQENPMLYSFTALEVVLMGRYPQLPTLGFEGPKDVEIALACMEKTRCAALSDRSVNELSGGERQRVLIARALTQEPEILLMDEPTSHLDLRFQLEFLDLLLDLNGNDGMTIVWVSHDLNLASLVCRRLLLVKDGRIVAQGDPDTVLTADNIRDAFGRQVIVDKNPQSGAPRITPLVGVD